MNILFKRQQIRTKFANISFRLWAKLELDESEIAVIEHYKFDQAILIGETQLNLVRKSMMVGAGITVAVSALLLLILNFTLSVIWGLLLGAGLGYFYYDQNREVVYVKDLLHGRHFSCDSVIELARKEAWLERLSAFLRQVMESAKHWDGTEARPIEVLPKEEAKNLIIRGLS